MTRSARLEALVFALFAALQAAIVVACFQPGPSSFWGYTFFQVNYTLAVWAVPGGCALIAATISARVHRTAEWRAKRIASGAWIGALSFVGYSIFHIILAALSGAGVAEALTLVLPIFLFGGIFILPVSIAMGVLASLCVKRLSSLANP